MNFIKNMPPKSKEVNEGDKLNTFNIRLALKDSSYFPEINEIYSPKGYNPILTEGCSYHSETFNKSDEGFILNNFENISIDKITLLFNSHATRSNNYTVKRYWKIFDEMIDSGNSNILSGNSLYNCSCIWNYFFNIQWDCVQTKHPTIRLEFNPNKAEIEKLIPFFSCIKKYSFESARVSRIDIAVDYGIYLEPFCWFAKNTPTDNYHRKNGIIQTIYFGSSKSDNQLRVYNKAEELNKNGILFDCNLWRVEAEIRSFKDDDIYLSDINSMCSLTYFDKLFYFDTYCFKPNRTPEYNLFIYNARVYGVDFASSLLSRATKYRYFSYLKQDVRKLTFNLPVEIYKHCFKSVYTGFYSKLKELFDKGQELALTF